MPEKKDMMSTRRMTVRLRRLSFIMGDSLSKVLNKALQ